MKIIREDSFKNQEKKLKKHIQEWENYQKILTHIKLCQSSEELLNSVVSKMYGIEKLKYQLNEYYSFNLCKNKGTIRLIFQMIREENEVYLVFISLEHYEDFKRKMR